MRAGYFLKILKLIIELIFRSYIKNLKDTISPPLFWGKVLISIIFLFDSIHTSKSKDVQVFIVPKMRFLWGML